MGLFSFTQDIAMDLGTANTIIINNGKIVVDEPSVVALDRRTDKMIAVGERAKMMYEKENPNIRTVRPLRDGVIADFNACEQMMRGLIKKVNIGNRFFSPSLRMVIGVPSGSTEVELRAVRDSAEHAGGRDVYLLFEPMAAAIGIGIDVEAPEGRFSEIAGDDNHQNVPGSGGRQNKQVQLHHDRLVLSRVQRLQGGRCRFSAFEGKEGVVVHVLQPGKSVRKHGVHRISGGGGQACARVSHLAAPSGRLPLLAREQLASRPQADGRGRHVFP